MTDISPKSLRMLKQIKRLDYIPEDKIPPKFNRYRLQFLVDNNLGEFAPHLNKQYNAHITAITEMLSSK